MILWFSASVFNYLWIKQRTQFILAFIIFLSIIEVNFQEDRKEIYFEQEKENSRASGCGGTSCSASGRDIPHEIKCGKA